MSIGIALAWESWSGDRLNPRGVHPASRVSVVLRNGDVKLGRVVDFRWQWDHNWTPEDVVQYREVL